MRQRGQTTVEYAGLALLVAILLFGAAHVARAELAAAPRGDAAFLDLAARHAPSLTLERGDDSLPVDFRTCRSRSCAGRDPVAFVHGVRRHGFVYLEYWFYLPDSRTASTGIDRIDGAHIDDWEGIIVKLRTDGTLIGARASAHLGWNGLHPWWELKRGDWAPYPAPVYRAAGSHAASFRPSGIDLAGDRWDGPAATVTPRLVPADQARRAGASFGSGSIPPWQKDAWRDPESVTTGRPGSAATYARYARWWANVCVVC
jgi:hypothetical protein